MVLVPGPGAAAIYARISEDRAGEMLGIKRQLEDCGPARVSLLDQVETWTLEARYAALGSLSRNLD